MEKIRIPIVKNNGKVIYIEIIRKEGESAFDAAMRAYKTAWLTSQRRKEEEESW